MTRALAAALAVGLLACAGGPAASEAPDGCAPPPADPEALDAWLEAECHRNWPAEAAIHPAGMAPGGSRVFANPTLADSLAANHASHPIGAAAVRELYAEDLQTLTGYAVMIKVAADPADGWFWFERFLAQPKPSVAARSAPGCTGCHASEADFVQPMGALLRVTPE